MKKETLAITICVLMLLFVFISGCTENGDKGEKEEQEETQEEITILNVHTDPEVPTEHDTIYIDFTINNTISNASIYEDYRVYLLFWHEGYQTPGAKSAGGVPQHTINQSILIGSDFDAGIQWYYKIVILNGTYDIEHEPQVNTVELIYDEIFNTKLILESETYTFTTIS